MNLLIESQAAINTVLFIGVSHLGYFTGPSVGSSSVICYKTLRTWDEVKFCYIDLHKSILPASY